MSVHNGRNMEEWEKEAADDFFLHHFDKQSIPMRVYLIACGWDYEGDEIKAVLSTREEANQLAEKYRNKELFSFDRVRIQEWEIGKAADKRWEKNNVI